MFGIGNEDDEREVEPLTRLLDDEEETVGQVARNALKGKNVILQ